MSSSENDALYTVYSTCYLCNHVFQDLEEPWYIFNKEIRDDGHIEFSIASLLSTVLERDVDEKTAHSTFLCEICNANLLEYESLKRRLQELQERIKQSYEQTLISISVSEVHKGDDYEDDVAFANAIHIDSLIEEIDTAPFVLNENLLETHINDLPFTTSTIIEESTEFTNIKKSHLLKKEVDIETNIEEYAEIEGFTQLYEQCENSFSCSVCNEADFPDIQQLAAHLRNKHLQEVYDCEFCDQLFVEQSELNTHIQKEHAPSEEISCNYECKACKLVFENFRQFRLHRRLNHSNSKLFECTECKKTYSSQNVLKEHMNTHTGQRPYKCHKCGKAFAAKNTLHAHAKIHTERKRPFQCKRCDKTFLNQQNLLHHEKLHAEVKPFVCNVCQKAFKTQHNLDVHKIVHTGERPFICRTCGKSFARRSEIKDHERTHTGERPFKCDMCPLAFAQRSNLSSHKKYSHFNQKLHKCEQCERSFKRRRLLDYHIQAVHTGERPHKCQICGVGFVYPEHYKNHLLIHTGLKPYACEVCGKEFKSRDNRNAHRFVHSDKKPYECLQCGAGFMRKPQLLQHMNNTAHATDTIIVNQPQININNSLILKEKQTVTKRKGEKELKETITAVDYETILPMENGGIEIVAADKKLESTLIINENFVTENLGVVKYLHFEDID